MNPETLLAHFDRLADAPDAVAHLRQFILGLAVRGRLVEQDPKDEPASELFNRVQRERDVLLQAGKIKVPELNSDFDLLDFGFALPDNWLSTRIGELLTVIRGASPRPKGDPKYFSAERTQYHWIKISDIRKHSKQGVLSDTDEFLTEEGAKKSVLLPKGTLVVTNSATIGVPVILGFEGGCIHDGYLAFPFFPELHISQRFFFMLFQTLQEYATRKARGMAQLNLNTNLVREFPVALPPLAEQYRIVAKVEELMALCDQLEAAQAARESQRNRLVTTSLERLDQPNHDLDTFREHVRFHLDNLPRLVTRPEQVAEIQQTILNLAVRGKLVEQDPGDAPAADLINNIQLDKQSKTHKFATRSRNEIPAIVLPQTWLWTTLGEIANDFRYGTSAKCNYEPVGNPVLRIPNIDNGRINLDDLKYATLPLREVNELQLRSGDLLIVRSNGSLNLVGRPAVVEDHAAGYCYAGYLVRVRTHAELIDPQYLVIALNSTFTRQQIEYPIRTAVGLKNINSEEISKLAIPLPPLLEQRRIVTKVKELLALCHQLDAQLLIARTTSTSLLEVVLSQVLGVPLPIPSKERITKPQKMPDSHNSEENSTRVRTTNFSGTQPVITTADMVACVDDLGKETTPERLLSITGLSDDVDSFFDLLREAKRLGLLIIPTDLNQVIRKPDHAT